MKYSLWFVVCLKTCLPIEAVRVFGSRHKLGGKVYMEGQTMIPIFLVVFNCVDVATSSVASVRVRTAKWPDGGACTKKPLSWSRAQIFDEPSYVLDLRIRCTMQHERRIGYRHTNRTERYNEWRVCDLVSIVFQRNPTRDAHVPRRYGSVHMYPNSPQNLQYRRTVTHKGAGDKDKVRMGLRSPILRRFLMVSAAARRGFFTHVHRPSTATPCPHNKRHSLRIMSRVRP